MKLKLALLGTLALAGTNAFACYTVYDRNDRMVYNAERAPVDMSRPLHETLPRAFPGGHMVFEAGGDCPRTNTIAANAPAPRVTRVASASPLLTDRSTAEALRVPHTNVGNDIALVPATVAARLDLPHFTVIPADTTALAAARSPTAVMGAAPAQGAASFNPTAVMGAAPAPAYNGVRRAPSRGTVITELRDPPMTIVQQGSNYIVQR
jgi:hypothetical protein